jgi:hydrogenase maturation protease
MSEECNNVVIGLGNPDCGDDGVGPLVARAVSDRIAGLRVIERRGDALALMEDWAGAEAVVLIDAAAAVSEPGRIHRIDLAQEELPRDLSLSSTHAFGVADAIALARTLGRLPPQVIVYAVEGENFAPGDPMSPAVAAAAENVAARILSELAATGDFIHA